MAGSTFGTLFSITTWGESHGAGIGVITVTKTNSAEPTGRTFPSFVTQALLLERLSVHGHS